MNKKKLFLAVAVAAIVLSVVILPAIAYFTAHAEAEGTVELALGMSTVIEEPTVDLDSWEKHVVITNEGPESVFVRARAFAGSKYKLDYEGEGWTDGKDGYWYYSEILPEGGESDELIVKIGNVPEDADYGDKFNVVVIYEAVKVEYNADGSTKAPDWSMAAVIDNGGEN
ncbi:MAG: hypothetical protein IKE18_10640 [Oscillospiraceae bacterium]|nr:hypothetical protein [Oscillospiraceae bacterium]